MNSFLLSPQQLWVAKNNVPLWSGGEKGSDFFSLLSRGGSATIATIVAWTAGELNSVYRRARWLSG
ncbi:hypothetical protein ACOMHN_005500 [Nucella lapillus]